MNISTILSIAFILIVDFIIFTIDRKNKVIFPGRNKYGIMFPVAVIVFLILTFVSKGYNLKTEDIIILIALLPLAVIGNKSGITEKGILLNSYVTIWDKIECYSLEKEVNKYMFSYKTNVGVRKIYFKEENIEEIKAHLAGIKRLKRYRK